MTTPELAKSDRPVVTPAGRGGLATGLRSLTDNFLPFLVLAVAWEITVRLNVFPRVLMPSLDLPSSGQLGGRTRDGRVLRGLVEFVGQGPTLRVRGPVLVEWRGVGSLGAVEPADEG